jgi:hypothetical protein
MGTQVLTERAVIGRFYARLEQGAHPWANALCWDNPNADQGVGIAEKYRWLGQAPTPREFIGPLQAKELSQFGYDITNKRWESSIRFPLLDWTHDKTGQIMVRVDDMASRFDMHRARLLSTLMINAEATACYDGQYFFDDDHPESGASQSNDLSVDISALPVTNHGSTTAPSAAEMTHCIMQAVQAMLGFKDDQGEPVNENARAFDVIVPATFWFAASMAVGARVLASGEDNPVAVGSMDGFKFNLHSNARLTWTTKFAVFRRDGVTKPFIFQSDGGVKTKLLGPDSEHATLNDEVLFTADAINNAGYGDWKHACLVTLA